MNPGVLVVDDDPGIRKTFERTLKLAGIPVKCAASGAEALSILESGPESFATIVADYWMPEMDGAEVLAKAAKIAPPVSRILTSGNLELPAVMQAVNAGGIYQVLPKPWESGQLIGLLQRAMERARLERENARLLAELQQKNETLLRINEALDRLVIDRTTTLLDGLISALDLRDTDTQWHSRRVAAYAVRLANELGLEEDAVRDVEYGALLHDVGKIGIPDAILRKPGALSEGEWALMRTHPRLGYELVRNIDFLEHAALVPFHHHERFDGTGYPQKLAGDQIALAARIFSVVDAVDVITTNRPYRRARGFEAAREELSRCAGTQFDPAVVSAYLRVPDAEWKAIQAAHIDEDERESATYGQVVASEARTSGMVMVVATGTASVL